MVTNLYWSRLQSAMTNMWTLQSTPQKGFISANYLDNCKVSRPISPVGGETKFGGLDQAFTNTKKVMSCYHSFVMPNRDTLPKCPSRKKRSRLILRSNFTNTAVPFHKSDYKSSYRGWVYCFTANNGSGIWIRIFSSIEYVNEMKLSKNTKNSSLYTKSYPRQSETENLGNEDLQKIGYVNRSVNHTESHTLIQPT